MRAKPKIERPAPVEPAGSTTGTLLKGLKIIEALGDAASPLGLAELSERLSFDNSTTHRLVQILIDEGFVVRADASKRYCLGPRSISRLAVYHPINNFVRDTYEILQHVRDETGETITLVIFVGIERVIVNLVQGRENLPTTYGMWLRSPLHASASGKCLLMTMSAPEMRAVLGPGPLAAATEFTTTDLSRLIGQIEDAKKAGYVLARDDAFVGLTAIGAPISRNSKGIACLCIAGSSIRLTNEMSERYGQALARAAGMIMNLTPSLPYIASFIGR